MGVILTIGHSRHDITRFLALLRQHQVSVLAELRRKPWSRRHPQFNRDRLARALPGGSTPAGQPAAVTALRTGGQVCYLGVESHSRRPDRS